MQDLSLHVLDIAENSIEAGATKIEIFVNENIKKNLLTIRVKDNGKGMDKQRLKRALDPFYTTKKSKRIGLGISMFAQAAREADGAFSIKSRKGEGTTIAATFVYDHIDRKPLGDMTETLIALIAGSGLKTDFVYKHKKNSRCFDFNTRNIKKTLNGVPINDCDVLRLMKKNMRKELKNVGVVP